MIRRSRTCCEALSDFFCCVLAVITCWFCCRKVSRTAPQPGVAQQSHRRQSSSSGIPPRNVTQINVGSVHVYPGAGGHQYQGNGVSTPGSGATFNADNANGRPVVSPAALQAREDQSIAIVTDAGVSESGLDNYNIASPASSLIASTHDDEGMEAISGEVSRAIGYSSDDDHFESASENEASLSPAGVIRETHGSEGEGVVGSSVISTAGPLAEGGAAAFICNVTRREKVTVTAEHVRKLHALGFTSEILDETDIAPLQLRVDQGYRYLEQIIKGNGDLDRMLTEQVDDVWQKEKRRVESGQDVTQRDEPSTLLLAIKTAIRTVVAEGGVTDDVKAVAKERALESATKEIITQICNYLYFLAVSSDQAFTDGSYILTDDVGGGNVRKLADFLKRENNGHYERPSSHIKEESDAWKHYGYDLDVNRFFPEDHRHVLFIDYDDKVNHLHKLFFKPEHYGMRGWSDTFWHLYEWAESILKRVGVVATHEAGKVDKKERVKYLKPDERDLMKRFVSLLEQPLEKTIIVKFDEGEDEESLEYQMLYPPVVCNKSEAEDLNKRIETYGYREIFRLMKMFMDKAGDHERRRMIQDHFDPLLKDIKDKHPDYSHRSANEVLIAI